MVEPNDLPIAKKHKSMDSDEDDEEPQNEPGISSTFQFFVPVLPLNQGPAASSQGPAANAISDDENSEYSDEQSERSQNSGRTVLYPDLYILTDDEHWTVPPETHKCAANEEQQDIYNLTTVPSVHRTLCLKAATDNSGSTRAELPNGDNSQTRNMLERSTTTCGKAAGARAKVRFSCAKRSVNPGYYKQSAEAKHIEWKY